MTTYAMPWGAIAPQVVTIHGHYSPWSDPMKIKFTVVRGIVMVTIIFRRPATSTDICFANTNVAYSCYVLFMSHVL